MLKSILVTILSLIIGTSALVVKARSPQAETESSWPNGPFSTSGRWIQDKDGNVVHYAGTNWPGHGEVMIPEGLQYQSIETIVSKVKSIGMNVFRLTFAIEMIDQIYENGGEDIDIETAFINALGEKNGTRVLNMVLEKNPQFTAKTKRLEVYDAVVEEANKQEIYIHLDNHISKGMWCCSMTDGNAWWGDTYFNTEKWVRGLGYMVAHGRKWSNFMSISIRNEPRDPVNNPEVRETYNWRDWYGFIKQGAESVHRSNSDVIIFLSGLNYDTYVTPVFRGTVLEPGTETFNWDNFAGYNEKLALEIHNYETGINSCDSLKYNLYTKGLQAMHPEDSGTVNVFPVMVTEFGFAMDGSTWQNVYGTCLAEYLPSEQAGWMIWVLVGSYYVRSGIQDYDETWGLMNHDWSEWRDLGYIKNQAIPMVQASIGA